MPPLTQKDIPSFPFPPAPPPLNSAYFDEKGLVRQQLDSFDEFIQNTMQELVDDTPKIRVTPERQFTVGMEDNSTLKRGLEVSFGQIYIGQPSQTESDMSTTNIFPHEARLRGLTYAASLYVDIMLKTFEISEDDEFDAEDDTFWENRPLAEDASKKVFLGNVPIMLRSTYCVLAKKNDDQLCDLNECIFDQGGYFVVNGSEKVIIAQERMSNNHVYAFRKKQPNKFSWTVEVRSQVENSNRPTSTLFLQMYNKGGRGSTEGNQIRTTMPYIREDIPIVLIFRALGYISDRDVIEHVVYDLRDAEMMDLFKVSRERAKPRPLRSERSEGAASISRAQRKAERSGKPSAAEKGGFGGTHKIQQLFRSLVLLLLNLKMHLRRHILSTYHN